MAAGCSGVQWRRLAPPGIVKYEEIEGEKPPNAEIEKRVEQYREDGPARFPKLADAPSEADRPAQRSEKQLEQEISELAEAREVLADALEKDRAGAAADKEAAGDLAGERDTLTDEIQNDETSAKSERR